MTPVAALPQMWLPPSGFVVTPVLGWWRETSEIAAADPAEVADVHRVAIADLVNPANRVKVSHPSGLRRVGLPEVSGMLVWGFTGLCSTDCLTWPDGRCRGKRAPELPVRRWLASLAGFVVCVRSTSSAAGPIGDTMRTLRSSTRWRGGEHERCRHRGPTAIVLFAWSGWRNGFVSGLLSFIGFLGGGLIGVFLAPLVPRPMADRRNARPRHHGGAGDRLRDRWSTRDFDRWPQAARPHYVGTRAHRRQHRRGGVERPGHRGHRVDPGCHCNGATWLNGLVAGALIVSSVDPRHGRAESSARHGHQPAEPR